MSVSKFLGSISNTSSGSGDKFESDENMNSKIVKYFIGWSDLDISRKAGFFSFIGGALSHTFLPSFLGGEDIFNMVFVGLNWKIVIHV